MKSLATVAILVVLIAQVVSAATDVCPTGTLTGETEFLVGNIQTTDTYIANCRIYGNVGFSIDLPESESTTYVTVENSTIFSYSLNFILQSWSLAPFAIVVKNNLFNLAYLTVTGNLGKNSSVTIQGNTMSADGSNNYYTSMVSIFIESLTLSPNASLNIVNNFLNVSNRPSANYKTVPLYIERIYLDSFSSVNILRNTITATGITQGMLIYIYKSDHVDNSALRVMGNTLTSTSTLEVVAYESAFVMCYGDSGAVYVFSNNFVNVTNTPRALKFFNTSDVLLSVDENQITYSGENAIYFNSIDRLSGLSISGNAIHSTSGALGSPVILADHYNVLPDATYVISNNKVTATSKTATRAPLLRVVDVRFNYFLTKIQYCGNTLPWSDEPTAEQLFSSELLDYVVASCNDVATTASANLGSFGGTAFGIVISVVVAHLLL